MKRDRNGEMFKYWSARVANGKSPTPRDSRARDATASPPTWVRPPGAGGTAGTLRESEAATEVPERVVLLGPLAQQISPIRPIQLANGDPDDDTDFWLTIPGFGNSLIEAEADYATGRTSGEEEIRTRFRLASPRTQPPDGHVAAERETARSFTRSDRPETISDPWSVLGR